MGAHERQVPWPQSGAGSVIAACSCGWESAPCANGEFANQAWERHAEAQSSSLDDDA
jgi:hypothetical protein